MVSPLWLHWVMGVWVFRSNRPPALLVEWPGSFMCHCGNTGVEQTLNKNQHRKLTLEKKILAPLLPGFELATFWSWVCHSTSELSQLSQPTSCQLHRVTSRRITRSTFFYASSMHKTSNHRQSTVNKKTPAWWRFVWHKGAQSLHEHTIKIKSSDHLVALVEIVFVVAPYEFQGGGEGGIAEHTQMCIFCVGKECQNAEQWWQALSALFSGRCMSQEGVYFLYVSGRCLFSVCLRRVCIFCMSQEGVYFLYVFGRWILSAYFRKVYIFCMLMMMMITFWRAQVYPCCNSMLIALSKKKKR